MPAQIAAERGDRRDGRAVLVVGAVGEVEAEDARARLGEATKLVRRP
jgi:hypothetical protein